MQEEMVVLVDSQDEVVGEAPKLRAHQEGRLHRAISVLLFNEAGETLLQRRAAAKYHSAGLWSNTCCSHPRPGESPHDAAVRRLHEEMGMECPLRHSFSFIYKAHLAGGLTEHELDHVYTGVATFDPHPDPAEVDSWRWVALDDLLIEVDDRPARFTAWFPLVLEKLLDRAAQ